MKKLINPYGTYTPVDIKNRSSVPLQSDISVVNVTTSYQYKVTNECQPATFYWINEYNEPSYSEMETGQWTIICTLNEMFSDTCFTLEYLGSCNDYVNAYLECQNISTSCVHNALQSAQYSVEALCSSPKVNKYSHFGPTEWISSGGVLNSRPITPFSLGNFACYNHNALKPTIVNYTTGGTFTIFDSFVKVYVDCNLGETDWFSKINATKLWLEVKIDNSVVATGWFPVTNTRNFNDNIRIWCDIPIVTYNDSKVAICKLYFTDTSNNMLGYVPGIIEFEIYLSYIFMGYEYYINNTCAAPLTYYYTGKNGPAEKYLGSFESAYICSKYQIPEQTGDCVEVTFSSMGCIY